MDTTNYREIPYNFTSADDRLIINHLFGQSVWDDLEELRKLRVTGRSARLVMRFMGDLFILCRNPFLYQELIDSPLRRKHFFKTAQKDLSIIEGIAKGYKDKKENVDCNDKVRHLVKICKKRLSQLQKEISCTNKQRARITRKLGAIIGKENVSFDPFSLIAHATDATDWRMFLPLAVLRPSTEEQIAPLLKAVEDLGLHVIPRGGGTGLTGGAVPVAPNCVIINTEKLNNVSPVSYQERTKEDGSTERFPVLKAEAGVITQDAMAAATAEGLIFATDPTSSWAATIGGNIAENAGGKKAVLWGTAIDNILAYSIAMPGGAFYRVQRVNHPLRKIYQDDQVRFDVSDTQGKVVKTIELAGDEIRKKGLWKDITNKALKGLPGVQKEGTDGIITSGEFVLYEPYEETVTFCLEFFGNDMDEASRVIVRISDEFVNQGEEALMALEHFDEEYIKAIDYKFKAVRSEHPKAVLLIDMVAHNQEQLQRGITRLHTLLNEYPNTEIFTAKDEDEATRFWRDRKRLGAIAARTNAFKLNEDIVLPLAALAEFARFVDEYNISEDIYNKKDCIRKILEYLETADPLEDPDWLEARIPKAHEICQRTLQGLDEPALDVLRQDKYINDLLKELLELFRGYSRVSTTIKKIFDKVRQYRIIIATHMHAGDGNVHVNIPVFSNDREMMLRAEHTAEDVMAKAVELGGVVSGEHGIGITKMKFLDTKLRQELLDYRAEVDPKGVMNPGKLDDPDIISKVFTPSFNLLELEARILQHRSLEALSNKIAQCIRCGKCKPDCCVFYPASNTFFHPRNKNLVIGSLIEALLYDMQRSHAPRFDQLKNLVEIADHCTMCGKCLPPCPVNIDTAAVSIMEREILDDLGYKHSPPATKLSLLFLKTRNKLFNTLFRTTVLKWGSAGQRFAYKVLKKAPVQVQQAKLPPIPMLQSPMMPASQGTLSDLLPSCNNNETLLLHPEQGKANGKTVFYFPGCGSERLYGDIAMASVYALVKTGTKVVIPPPSLCCGYPLKTNAKKEAHSEVSLRNSIILSQIREMLGHINFDKVLISCGTCREALHEIGTEEIFDCELGDISRYVINSDKEGLAKSFDQSFFYHAPCHDSLDGRGTKVVGQLVQDGASVQGIPHCCSEAGTMALSRPDISGAMLQRKHDLLKDAHNDTPDVDTIVTNCPSCLSGLGRNRELGIQPQHLAVLLAEKIGGPDWQKELRELLERTETIIF